MRSATGVISSWLPPRTWIMIGASVAAPSTIGGSVTATIAPGAAAVAALRAASLSTESGVPGRSSFGTVTTRHFALFASKFGPTVAKTVFTIGFARSLASASRELRHDSATDVPAGSTSSRTSSPPSSAFMKSLPMIWAR